MIFRLALLTTANSKARSARELVRGLVHTAHPLLVQIIPIRRCNIDCGYCNEYDKVSPPVPAALMESRIDKLAALGTSVVAFSGGEPMLHPELDALIRHIRRRRLKPLGPAERQVYDAVSAAISGPWQVFKNLYSGISSFQDNLVDGKPNDWRCRAGGRYLYICEDGLVHYCSQQRGYPGVPLDSYTTADVKREFLTAKSCAPNCTIGCVHRISYIDHWRAPQTEMTSPGAGGLVQITNQ